MDRRRHDDHACPQRNGHGGMTTSSATNSQQFGDAGFPFRDLVVARTYEPRADAAATLAARAIADRMSGAVVVRAEDESLQRQARHAALVFVGTPERRRPAGKPGGDVSALARRLRVPVVVVPRRVTSDLTGLTSVVCGVRDPADRVCVAAAGALADALDLQLVLVHVWDEPAPPPTGPAVPPPGSVARRPEDRAAARILLGDVAFGAGRHAPGAACLRVIDGATGEALCRAGTEHRAALVAVGASRHGRLAAALLGSVARHVTRHADRPVLMCPRRLDPPLDPDRFAS